MMSSCDFLTQLDGKLIFYDSAHHLSILLTEKLTLESHSEVKQAKQAITFNNDVKLRFYHS